MGPFLPFSPELIAEKISCHRRILLFGESGSGKSTLAGDLGREFAERGESCLCISADPGSPSFGVPGALCLGRWYEGDWLQLGHEALCSLDAGRFRLPLASAFRRLVQKLGAERLLVDLPGIVRGVAGAEMLTELAETAGADVVVVLVRQGKEPPLANELAALGCKIIMVHASRNAREPGKRKRSRRRTRLWNAYLRHAEERILKYEELLPVGTPPPPEKREDWKGRQAALIKKGRMLAMGEILGLEQKKIRMRIAPISEIPDQILVRDAYRNSRGLLTTFKPLGALGLSFIPPPDITPCSGMEKNTGPIPAVRIGEATGVLVNGVFGDPLLHLRLHNRKRSVLFDLGEGARLPARLAHQVSDAFISHAHIDHISGFFWLLRSRIGILKTCRLFGPPGLAERIFSLINGIHWDRIGNEGPRFTVGEFHDDTLILHDIRAGCEGKKPCRECPAPGGLLLADEDCRVKAVTLQHGTIPVMAYSLEQASKFNVRKERLAARRLPPGPWLGVLKKRIAEDDRQAVIPLPDGSTGTAGRLADDLLLVTPAQRLVYATDLSDTEENREKLIGLAAEADIFFCETAFMEKDQQYGDMSGHLTTRGCGEIANAAGVRLLVPFHFSRRYEKNPHGIYEELKLYGRQVWREGISG
ncbi:MAG: Clp1/GlmU family protein [Desulfobulbaceae bacterium]|nr:Clp1/GlmU family protein [Desulfobulbaceae bacterium]